MGSEHAKACHRRGEIVTAIVVWLLLGAIVNVAVAWGCANYSNDFGVTYLYFASLAVLPDGSPSPNYAPPRFESAGWPLRSTTSKSVAVEPLWRGFAINTVFYAAILWLLFAAPFALRRRIRIQRGLCPACAYPVGASDVCTECGAKIKQSHKARMV